jgi:hypothetical protein
MTGNEELIKRARATVALITSYSNESEWCQKFPLMFEIFQNNANLLNESLGEHKWDWEEERRKDRERGD